METQERRERLLKIKTELGAHLLNGPEFLGDRTKRESEITNIVDINEDNKEFTTRVKYGIIRPDGRLGEHLVDFNVNSHLSDGSVVVTLINDKFLIAEHWRQNLSRWMSEFPRAFAHLERCVNPNFADKPEGAPDLIALPEEVAAAQALSSEMTMTYVGATAENSGTSANMPTIALARLRLTEPNLEALLQTDFPLKKLRLWTHDRLRAELGRRIKDNHSLAAYLLTQPLL